MKLVGFVLAITLGVGCARAPEEPRKAQTTAKSAPQKWPVCVAEFCFDSRMADRDILNKYGLQSAKMDDLGHMESVCYRVQEQGVFVELTIDHHGPPGQVVGIKVSSELNCEPGVTAASPQSRFAPLETREGVRVGDTESKVIEVYGRQDPVLADQQLIYGYWPESKDELLFSTITVKSGKVSSILIYAGE